MIESTREDFHDDDACFRRGREHVFDDGEDAFDDLFRRIARIVGRLSQIVCSDV